MQVILLDYISTIVFAFNGTIAYMNVGSNLLIAVFCGLLTSIGGGTIRDTMNGAEIFWLRHPIYLFLSFFISIIAICVYKHITPYYNFKNHYLSRIL